MSHLACLVRKSKPKTLLYYAHMIETNKYLNLTGITDMKEVVVKHMTLLSCYDSEIIKSDMTISDVVMQVSLVFHWLSMTVASRLPV